MLQKTVTSKKVIGRVLKIYNTSKTFGDKRGEYFLYQMWKSPCVEGNLSVSFFPSELIKIKVTIEMSLSDYLLK